MVRRGKLLPHLLSLLAFTAVAVAWATFLLSKGGGLPSVGSDAYKVSAIIPSGAALAPGSRVTMAGVHVGTVKDVARQGMGARIELEIDDEDVLPLATDSRVQVRQHTPVGENYIALVAGKSSQTIESGGALAVQQADEFVDVDRLLSVLKGDTRERARMTIRSLGGALEGRGDKLNDLVGDAAGFLDHGQHLVDVLHRDRVQAGRLVAQLGDVAAAIGQRDGAITTIANQGLTSLETIGSRDDALRRTIEELPESLRRVRGTSDTVRTVSAVTRPVVDDAAEALRVLRPAVGRLQPTADAGRRALSELGAAAPGLRTTLSRVTALSNPLSAALPKLHKTICEAAPVLRYIKPHVPEMLHILMGLGSSSNSYDATGHLIRLAPIFSENSLSGAPEEVSVAANELLYGGFIGENAGTAVNFDPYPAVGSLGRTAATTNVPIGPSRVPATGYKYPRVEADC